MNDFQVIVVGGGPTGLTAANLLARYGVRALLVERNLTTVTEPRAVSIDDESLRTMQAAGAETAVLEKVVSGYGSEYYSPSGKAFLVVRPTDTPYGFARRNAFRQPILEQQLRDHLENGPVQTLFGWCVTRVENGKDGVRLEIESHSGERRCVSADYVIAADGASSPIRTMLGLSLDGETFSEKWLIVDLEDSPTESRETKVFCDTRRPCIALPGPDHTRRFEFKLIAGDDPAEMVRPENVRRLLEERGIAPSSRICRSTVYTFHARLASKWSKGRTFLAGDACHLTPPFAGQGMNSGIRDAHNLAWKLAMVTAGQVSPGILDSYEDERRAHVGEMIKLALRMGRIMGPRTRATGLITQTAFRLLGLWPAARDYFAQMKYKPKPRFAKGLLLEDGRPRRVTAVGRLLPQPEILSPSGRHLLDQALGDGFALLGFVSDPQVLGQIASSALFRRLGARSVFVAPVVAAAHSTSAARTEVSQATVRDEMLEISDCDGALRANLDDPDGRIFVVRPDRYVLGAFRPDEAAAFIRRLERILGNHEPILAPEVSEPCPQAA